VEGKYDHSVIRRLYVHNFRCLENFELPLSGHSSVLLIGKNGSGKTAVALALEILRRIARGTNQVDELVKPNDFNWGRDLPMRFEIEVELNARVFAYSIAFSFRQRFKDVCVFKERLAVEGEPVYTREMAKVQFAGMDRGQAVEFAMDWHLVALPIVELQGPVFAFREWLGQMLILRPIPSLISGESNKETLKPNLHVSDFGAWFSGLLNDTPAAYSQIVGYLKQVMPDLSDIKNPLVGKDARSLVVQFSNEQRAYGLPFEQLSDGEKCFMICAMVLTANNSYGPLVCFWDEPDSHLALDEVGHFVLALRKAFQSGGQFIATSHSPEVIRHFSDENTLLLYRKSHLEPTVVRLLSEIHVSGDLVSALVRGDVEP
jgi:energy-coupling factor transporter ATP-binding protein EcfA2